MIFFSKAPKTSKEFVPPKKRHEYKLKEFYEQQKRQRYANYFGLFLALMIPGLLLLIPSTRQSFANIIFPKGEIEIISSPQKLDLQVFIDDKEVGKTPYYDKLRVGQHTVKLIHSGFETYEIPIFISEKQTQKIVISPSQWSLPAEIAQNYQEHRLTPRMDIQAFEKIDMEDWQRFSDDQNTFSFSYPPNLEIESQGNQKYNFWLAGPTQAGQEQFLDGIKLEMAVLRNEQALQSLVSQTATKIRDDQESTQKISEYPLPIKIGGRVGYRFQTTDKTTTTFYYIPLSNQSHLYIKQQTKDPTVQGYYNISLNIISSIELTSYTAIDYINQNSIIESQYFDKEKINFLQSQEARNFQKKYFEPNGNFFADQSYPQRIKNLDDEKMQTIYCVDEIPDPTKVLKITKGCLFENGSSAIHFEIFDNNLQDNIQHFGLLQPTGKLITKSSLPYRVANYSCHTALGIDHDNYFYYICGGGDANWTEASIFAVEIGNPEIQELKTCITYKKSTDTNLHMNPNDKENFQTYCID